MTTPKISGVLVPLGVDGIPLFIEEVEDGVQWEIHACG
jgi:hypothetical protein